jgi:hypothetical protein
MEVVLMITSIDNCLEDDESPVYISTKGNVKFLRPE